MELHPYQKYDTELLASLPWNIQMVNAPAFWPVTKGGGAIIAVVDTGLDVNHPEFSGRIVGGWNFTGEYNNLTDADGHGTHVAGTAAGKTCGVAPEARIMPLKVFGDDKVNENIKQAFRYILNWNATHSETDRVIAVNCSFGGTMYDPEQAYLIRRLVATGVTVCVAAGNAGDGEPSTEEIFSFPGYLWESLTTGAINQDGLNARYSSSYDGIDIGAPGTQIYSAWPGGGYKLLSGTSMATPHITGAMALLCSAWFLKKGEWPTEAKATAVLMNHLFKGGLDDRFVGEGTLDLTWDESRWPWIEVVLTIGSRDIVVDGVLKTNALDMGPFIAPEVNRTFVPLHGVFEELGIDVGWNGDLRQVTLRKENWNYEK